MRPPKKQKPFLDPAEVEKKIVTRIERSIRGHDLTQLAKAGANKDFVLRLLAGTAVTYGSASTKTECRKLRAKEKELRALADEIRRFGSKARMFMEIEKNSARHWRIRYSLGKQVLADALDRGAHETAKEACSRFIDVARWADQQADELLELVRTLEVEQRGPYHALVDHIEQSTGRNFDKVVSRLLTATYAALGIDPDLKPDVDENGYAPDLPRLFKPDPVNVKKDRQRLQKRRSPLV